MADPVTEGTKSALSDASAAPAVPKVSEGVPAAAVQRRQRMQAAERLMAAEAGSKAEDRAARRLVRQTTRKPLSIEALKTSQAKTGASKAKPKSFLPAALVARLPEAATYAFQQRLGTAPKPKS
jgi:hypothetical protein